MVFDVHSGLSHVLGAAIAVGIALLPGFSPARAQDDLRLNAEVTTFTLDNGLDVVVVEDHRAPVATHMVWYRVGSADEPLGKSGIAHFLEHLMFKGTEKHPAGEFSKVVAEIGGQENAFTSQDYTAYFQRVAKDELPRMMEFEADRMANLQLTEEAVTPELSVILEERRSRVDNDPSSRLSEITQAALYLHHPYGTPIIGWEHEMRGLTRQDAIAFYDRFYTPNNAVLVIAGDVTPDEVRRLAEETYGKVARRADPGRRERVQEPPPIAPRRVTLADARVEQPTLSRQYLVPSYNTAEPGEAEALDVLSEALGGRSTSWLYRDLVVTKKVAASIRTWYQSSAYDETRFAISAVPREGVSLEALEEAIDASLDAFLKKGIDAAEVTRIAESLTAQAIYATDSQATLARLFGAALTTGGTVEEVTEWPARVMEVTDEAVMAAARAYLKPERSVTGYLVKSEAEIRS